MLRGSSIVYALSRQRNTRNEPIIVDNNLLLLTLVTTCFDSFAVDRKNYIRFKKVSSCSSIIVSILFLFVYRLSDEILTKRTTDSQVSRKSFAASLPFITVRSVSSAEIPATI